MIAEFVDINAYYDESRKRDENRSTKLRDVLARIDAPVTRWEVRNREPREPISSHKRAIIHERDGGQCRYCFTTDERLVLDHIVPRSAFAPDKMHIADRSDNLQSACWSCNESRSNYEHPTSKRIGVTGCCWYCANPDYEQIWEETQEDPRPDLLVPVFCGRCGISAVPEVFGWIL